MLLFIEALLILAALGQDHTAAAEGQIYSLDMAPNSVDDQYKGCTENMTNMTKNLLGIERNYSSAFNEAWQEGENKTISPENNLTKSHLIAIYAYTFNKTEVYDAFNDAVYDGKQNYTDKKFTWYSLHFLLTEAIQILKKTQNQCYFTYRRTTDTYNYSIVLNEVRFGKFASSSLDRTAAVSFGAISCFEIYTCEGANLTKYSKFTHQKEVLIPPYETFKIIDVKRREDQSELWCDTVFVLNSTGKRSYMNCALFNSGNHVAVFNLLLILLNIIVLIY